MDLQNLSEPITRLALDVRQITGYSLSQGKPGLALWLSQAGEIYHNPDYTSASLELIDSALDDVDKWMGANRHTPSGLSLYGGVSGAYFVASTIAGKTGEYGLAEVCNDFDTLLLERLIAAPWDGHFDIISGLVGLGIYANSRQTPTARTIVETITSLLLSLGIRPNSEHLYWETTLSMNPNSLMLQRMPSGCLDLGMAHGNAGVIGFLAMACNGDVNAPTTSELAKCINWLMSTQNASSNESTFPYTANEPNQDSRCAWCYGDLGISLALSDAASILNDRSLSSFAETVVEKLTDRDRTRLGIVDPWLCHGYSGAMLLSGEIARRFNNKKIQAFSDDMRSLSIRAIESIPRNEIDKELGYLEGLSGALLALSYERGSNSSWCLPLGFKIE